MSVPEFSPEMQPYVSEQFWNGHMLGDGDGEAVRSGLQDLKSLRFAKEALEERLLQMQSLLPLETFTTGMTFSAEAYNPGAVVLLREHKLTNRGSGFATEPLPEPIMALNLQPTEGFSRIITEHDVSYSNAVRWGVVSETKKGDPALITFGASMVHKIASNRMRILGGYGLEPCAKMGETHHTVSGKRELLTKVSLLYVCGYGKAKPARKPLAERLSSLVLKPFES